jgi:hypothetical protein
MRLCVYFCIYFPILFLIQPTGHATDFRRSALTILLKLNLTFDGVSKSFRTGRLERELQMAQLSATRCSCNAILWVSLLSFAAITLRDASQRVFVVVVVIVYFVIDSVRKLLDTPPYLVKRINYEAPHYAFPSYQEIWMGGIQKIFHKNPFIKWRVDWQTRPKRARARAHTHTHTPLVPLDSHKNIRSPDGKTCDLCHF